MVKGLIQDDDVLSVCRLRFYEIEFVFLGLSEGATGSWFGTKGFSREGFFGLSL